MKGLKAIGILLVIIVVLVIGVFVAGFVYVDTIAKAGVEKGATYALDVPTTLGSADVQVFAGKFSMSGLKVSNPQGFSSPHFLNLGEGGVAVSLGTLNKKTVVLPDLHLTDIDVNLQKSGGKANYKVILDNLKRLESGGKPKEPKAGSGGGKDFVINKVEIKNITAHVDLLPIGGDATKVDVTVPEIILTDVGQGGVPMSQLVNVITQAILTAIVKNGGGLIPGDILGELQGQLGQLSSLGDVGVKVLDNAGQIVGEFGKNAGDLGKAAEDVTKAANEAVEGAKKGAEDAADKIKGLLGGDKKKDGGK